MTGVSAPRQSGHRAFADSRSLTVSVRITSFLHRSQWYSYTGMAHRSFPARSRPRGWSAVDDGESARASRARPPLKEARVGIGGILAATRSRGIHHSPEGSGPIPTGSNVDRSHATRSLSRQRRPLAARRVPHGAIRWRGGPAPPPACPHLARTERR